MKATASDLVELTETQQRAWDRMVRAMRDFEKAGGEFYTVLSTLSGYNGAYVEKVDSEGEINTQDVYLPCYDSSGLAGFADDAHFFTFKEGVEIDDGESY